MVAYPPPRSVQRVPLGDTEFFNLSHIGIVTFVLAMAYFGTLISAANLLVRISKYLSRWQTQYIFYLGVVVHLTVRTITWGIFCWIVMTQQEYWENTMLVLLSLPEFIFLSAYLLLLFHWLEVVVFSRKQFIFATRDSFHKSWQRVFMGTHLAFYTVLVILYTVFFLSSNSEDSKRFYIALFGIMEASANFVLPTAHIIVWVYFSYRLAGFVFVTELAADTVSRMHWIMVLWSTGRLLRGTVILVQSGVMEIWKMSPVAYSMLMVLVLLMTEFLPFIFTLDWSIIGVLIFGEEAGPLSPIHRTPVILDQAMHSKRDELKDDLS